jgi:hypothetical protein
MKKKQTFYRDWIQKQYNRKLQSNHIIRLIGKYGSVITFFKDEEVELVRYDDIYYVIFNGLYTRINKESFYELRGG